MLRTTQINENARTKQSEKRLDVFVSRHIQDNLSCRFPIIRPCSAISLLHSIRVQPKTGSHHYSLRFMRA